MVAERVKRDKIMHPLRHQICGHRSSTSQCQLQPIPETECWINGSPIVGANGWVGYIRPAV